jgi:acetylornithine deacetylase
MGWDEKLAPFLRAQSGWAADLLGRLIALPSVSGAEAGIQAGVLSVLLNAGLPAQAVPIEGTVVDDPDYTPLPEARTYQDRPNVVVALPGAGGGRSAILNSHTDVVPAPDGMFAAAIDGGVLRGRGACDAKGQVVTALLAMRAVRELGLTLQGDVEAQFVVEEEAGGNGSLALLSAGRRADAAVILEPTGLVPRSANRGAAWFRLTVEGRPVHMGLYNEGLSAFDELVALLPLLREYEAGLRRTSRGVAGFPDGPSPVVVNIGRVRAGDWPSTVPGECIAEGGIAFLSNRTSRQIEAEVRDLLASRGSSWARAHASFALWGLRNEAFETPAAHPAVRTFREAAEEVLGTLPVEGWNASCDARLFYHRGGMPTLVFGAGDLRHAHALDEQIRLEDILRAAEVLVRFLARWCGPARKES